MAAVHAGALSVDCAECPHVPGSPGCDEPSQAVVWVDGEDRYYSCPKRMIPRAAVEWYEDVLLMQELPGTGPPGIRDDARFVDAYMIYRAAHAEFASPRARRGRAAAEKNMRSVAAIKAAKHGR